MNRGRSLGLVRKKKMAASAKENKSRIWPAWISHFIDSLLFLVAVYTVGESSLPASVQNAELRRADKHHI